MANQPQTKVATEFTPKVGTKPEGQKKVSAAPVSQMSSGRRSYQMKRTYRV